MTDKEYDKQKRRVERLRQKWIAPLGLRWWRITYRYSRQPIESRTDGNTTVAQTSVLSQYLRATITYDLAAIVDWSDEDLERNFVHECCHVLVHEMRRFDKNDLEDAMYHEERVVTMLASAFVWTRQAGERTLKGKRREGR